MNIFAVVRARVIKDFIIRNGYSSGEHVVAEWLRFLQVETGREGYRVDLEKVWLRSLGAVGETLHDLWSSLLLQEGYTGDEDGLRQFFRVFSGDTTDDLLLENGDFFLLENGDKLLLG